jgi:lon-related putative ATP-dependent protease
MHRTLLPTELRWTFPTHEFNDADLKPAERDRHGRPGALGQERALEALDLGLGIRERGFNMFIVGASGTGRTSTVRAALEDRARKEPPPADVILLYNFEDRDRPHALAVPAGRGPSVRKRYESLVDKMLVELEKAFDSERYIEMRSQLDEAHQTRTDELLAGTEEEARARGFLLARTGSALTLSVADEDGNALSEEAFEALADERKAELEQLAAELQNGLEDALRRIRALEKDTDEAVEKLARETAAQVLKPLIEDAKGDLKAMPRVVEHLVQVELDVLERLRRLVPESHSIEEGGEEGQAEPRPSRRLSEEEEDGDRDEPALLRYRVNVLVTQNPKAGAPVVLETLPTLSNLIGRIEHKVRQGETSTDFTRIKAGALFRGNGGYLLLHAQDLLRDPAAWEGLKRALKNRQIELDDPGEPGRMVTVASLRPEPVKLSVKVLLIGTPEIYYALSRGDPDFSKLFKVKVDFDIEMDRSRDRLQQYLRFLAGLAHEEKLLPLALDGAGRVLEHATRLCDDQGKLTTRFGDIADLVREASFFAHRANRARIDRTDVNQALTARAEREGFIELRMREDIATKRIRIETAGAVVGQINGLTVVDLGSYAFGFPVRISCAVGVGRGEIIDIERETELGGPLHTKGTQILRGLLLSRFGDKVPLRVAATICMEQSYSDIDGDSASLAEACALFSTLADLPLRQDMAITGSIDQRGNVQAVGGVNEKIEGFFRVCAKRGGGPHRVIIPASNARDLMLDEEIVAACIAGNFSVSVVDTLEDAMQALCDVAPAAWGARVETTLQRFGSLHRGDQLRPATAARRVQRSMPAPRKRAKAAPKAKAKTAKQRPRSGR